MSPEMNKFYLTFTNETLSDMQMRQIWIERKNNYLAQRGIPRQNPLDYMPKLRKYYEGLKKWEINVNLLQALSLQWFFYVLF